MPERQLVYPAEAWLHLWGGWALALAFLLRLALGYALERQTWLLDWQLLCIPLLLAALVLSACLLPRQAGYTASALLGGSAWLLSFSLLPRYGWPRGELPAWLLWGALGLLLLALAYRAAKLRRWQIALGGHGYEWMLNWAQDKPLAARLLTRVAMRGLVSSRH